MVEIAGMKCSSLRSQFVLHLLVVGSYFVYLVDELFWPIQNGN